MGDPGVSVPSRHQTHSGERGWPNRANDSALWRTAVSLYRSPVFLHHVRFKPSFDVYQRHLHVMCFRTARSKSSWSMLWWVGTSLATRSLVPVPPRRTRRADFPQRAPQVALVRLAVIPSLGVSTPHKVIRTKIDSVDR